MISLRFIRRLFPLIAILTLVAVVPAWADSGTFEGKSDHKTSGSVSIEKSGDNYVLKLGKDFKFDGAPDPKLGFGKDGYKKESLFAKLKGNKGAQTYALPAGLDPAKYNEVWLWCEKFNVPLGIAKLQ